MKYPEKYKNTEEKDYIEAEIVDDYDNKSKENNFYRFEYTANDNLNLLDKLKFKFSKTIFFISLAISIIFITIGILLSSTLIGTIFGIPLIILGIIIILVSIKLIQLLN